MRPSRVLGPARIELYWQTPEARRLHDHALRLRGTSQRPVSESVRRTTEWRNQAERLLTDVEQWTGRREPEERDYFYQKSMLLEGLIDLMLPGTARTRAIQAFVEFMRHADADRQYRALWFAFLHRLLETARANGRAEILAALMSSHHPPGLVVLRAARTRAPCALCDRPGGRRSDPVCDPPGGLTPS